MFNGYRVIEGGTIVLKGDRIALRLSAARQAIQYLLITHQPNRLAVEKPAHKAFPLALIAQQRVMGVLMLEAYEYGLSDAIEVPPTSAKKALTGGGRADKQLMELAARPYIAEADEHASDAVGVAIGALAYL